MSVRVPALSPDVPTMPVGLASLPPPPLRLARRLSRMAFGAGLLLAPLWGLGWAFARDINAREGIRLPPLPDNAAFVSVLLAWGMAALGAAVFFQLGRLAVVRAAFGDDAFGSMSFELPALGLSIVAPISLQAAVAVPFVIAGANFDDWMAFALVGTVHVHIAFSIAMGLAAWRLARGEAVKRVAVWPAVLLSLVPGAIIVFPPILVWVCGALIGRGFLRLAKQWQAADAAD